MFLALGELGLNTVLTIFTTLWLLSIAVVLYFYLGYFLTFARYRETKKSKQLKQVSVIIAVKNEATNLRVTIPLILNQHNVDFECIVVDDHSTDQSIAVLNGMQCSHLKVLQLKDGKGKKAAIQHGIENAQYNILIFTDADCSPQSECWLAEIAGRIDEQHQIVLGHSGFYSDSSFLNRLIRFENLMVATQYFSLALKGDAYMGVGRNLGYTREIYENSSAFKKHAHLKSGDDDLLVNEMANTTTVALAIHPQLQTKSQAKKTWKAYFYQKRRQLQAGEHYKWRHRFLLALFGASTLLFNIFTLILLYFSANWPIILMTFGLVLIVKSIVLAKVSKKLGEKKLTLLLGILEIFLIIYLTVVGISTWIWKVDRWK